MHSGEMIVTSKTKYADFKDMEKYIDDEGIANLKKAAEMEYVNMYDLTFAQFLQACEDASTIIGNDDDETVLQVYWKKRFEEFQTEFADRIKSTNVPPTKEQAMASRDLPKQTFAEGILVFCLQYFHLHNFREAEQLTLGDIIIARKDAYNTTMMQRRISAIQMANLNNGKK